MNPFYLPNNLEIHNKNFAQANRCFNNSSHIGIYHKVICFEIVIAASGRWFEA